MLLFVTIYSHLGYLILVRITITYYILLFNYVPVTLIGFTVNINVNFNNIISYD